MPLEIPGFYFDAAKNKYFKIEKAHTAPAAAPWSSDAVKRRRVDEEEAARRRGPPSRGGIRRSALRGDLVSGGMLARQSGLMRVDGDGGELRAAGWAGGVVGRGAAAFAAGGGGNMPCLLVAGEEQHTEVGVAYGTVDEEVLLGTYLEMDEEGRIGERAQQSRTMGRLGSTWAPLAEMVRCPQMSSLAYHEPSHQVLLTSRDPEQNCGLFMFSPPISTTIDDRRHWLIGQAVRYQRIAIRPRSQPQSIIHKCTPAPPASPLLCLVGTNSGVLSVNPNGAATSAATSSSAVAARPRRHADAGIGEILDQAFSPCNHNVAFLGGRQPRLWIADLRAPSADWTHMRTASAVAHLRCPNEHQLLTAGPRSAMALYDVRFLAASNLSSSSSSSNSSCKSRPLLRFPDYANAAHVHTGFDASTELGLAAAAHDDGTVKLFSLRSGRMLRAGGPLGALRAPTPIKALQFQRLPGERAPSLFVAEGTALRKFSFARADGDDEPRAG